MDVLAGTLEGIARGIAIGALVGTGIGAGRAATGDVVLSQPDTLQEFFTFYGATIGGGVGALVGGFTARPLHEPESKVNE